ncbi:cholecystokinin receptor type A-like [Littorina saxatilis]|uniref:cholecystokinin receptor type A-like n=1 Tax=Littorina saxatilis TaxID=31220 RepID=UPI0038B48CCA
MANCSTDINGTVSCTSDILSTSASPMIFKITPTTLAFDLLDLVTTTALSSTDTAYSNLSTPDFFSSNFSSFSNDTFDNVTMRRPRRGGGMAIGLKVLLPIYVLIFLLSVVGNVLVMVTLVQNKKMRTVTNVFLLNLAVSDLLLAVFCMPFTIIPVVLRNFVFGAAMCIMIRYLQGVSVSVSCFTLVAISLERYFAICRPLKSRSWQTLSHAYRCIAVCWVLAAVFMVPLAVYHKLRQVGPSTFKCEESWDNADWEKAYTMLINFMLLVLPVILMSVAYGCVCYTLWIGIKLEAQSERERQTKSESSHSAAIYSSQNGVSLTVESRRLNPSPTNSGHNDHNNGVNNNSSVSRPFRRFEAHRAMRQSNSEKSRAAKKRVIKMLFMIVVEFFVFWTPTYVLGTWIVFDFPSAQRHISPMWKSLFHLLSYVSACCNPITYCFMNKNFRQGFLAAFRCVKRRHVYASRRSEFSFSGHTASTRTGVSHVTTNYDKIRDSDELSEKSF